MEQFRQAGVFLALATLWLVAPVGAAFAADEEIQVYMDEIGMLKRLSLDVHVNNVIEGRNTPSYPGEQLSQGRTRITPEFGYAISNAFELGAYLPLIDLSRRGDLSVDGVKLRLKYVAPKPEMQSWFWGANLELGYVNHSLDENHWNGELKGILGWRSGKWTLATNANIDFKVSGPAKAPTDLQIASKLAYAISPKTSIGFESYNGVGPIKHPTAFDHNDQTIYAVIDTSLGNWDLNIGAGYGYGDPKDRFIIKAVIGVPIG